MLEDQHHQSHQGENVAVETAALRHPCLSTCALLRVISMFSCEGSISPSCRNDDSAESSDAINGFRKR